MNLSIAAAFFVLGAICGSFLGLVGERAFTGQSWTKGRSRCNSCREILTVRDLIPVLSWFVNRGRCRHCSSSVAGMYALYELVGGILFTCGYATFGLSIQLTFFLLALLPLGFVIIYDLRHTLIPPFASGVFIVLAALFDFVHSTNLQTFLLSLAYAVGIALFFFCLYAFSRGRAMGLGDTPISFGLALMAGQLAIAGLLFSFWIGGAIGIVILAARRGGPRMGIEVPFVPFMAAGFLLALLTQWNPLPF